MDFKSLLSKIHNIQEDNKTPGSFEKLERSVSDRAAADSSAKKKTTTSKTKEPNFDTSELTSALGGKLPKKSVGTVSRVHKTPDFEPDDDDDSEIVREQGVEEGFAGYQAYRKSKVGNTSSRRSREPGFTGTPGKFNKEGIRIGKDGTPVIKTKAYREYMKQKDNSDETNQGVAEKTPSNLKEWMNRVEGISEAVVPPNAVEIPSATSGSNVAGTLLTVQGNDPTLKGIIDRAVKDKKLVAVGSTAPQSTTSATKPATTTPSSGTTTMPVKEEEIDEVAAPGQEKWIKANKQRFIDQYGKKKGMSVLYATAWKRSKGKSESMNESKSPVMEGYTLEDILKRYPHETRILEDGWGVMDENLYEALRDYYFENGFIPRKVMYGDHETCRKHVMDCYAKDRGMLVDEGVQTASSGDAQFGPISGVDEGMGGLAAGAALGRVAGTAFAGPAGGFIGGTVGGELGSEAQDMLSDDVNELDDLDDLDDIVDVDPEIDDGLEDDSIDDIDDEFPFPDDMEDNDLDEDYMMEAKKHNKKMAEDTKETKTGRVHKAEPGGYGRMDDEDDDGKKVKKAKDAPKRGRGRPKKDADSETGEVKKWDTDTLARWIVGSKPDKLPGKTSVKHKIKDESANKSKKMDAQMESWDRDLKTLLNEGMTITTSTGQPGGMDSVSVSATDSDAQTLLQLLQHAGIGLGGKSMGGDSEHSDGQMISVQPAAHDEVMSQLQPEDDSGDESMDFLKRMIGARGGDTAVVDMDYESEGDDEHAEHDHSEHEDEDSCEECGHDPCDCDSEQVDEDDVEEGNAFTGALAKARSDGVQKGETMSVDGKKYPVKHGKKMDKEDEDADKEKVDEGWKEKLGALGTAAAIGMGSMGAANAAEPPSQTMSTQVKVERKTEQTKQLQKYINLIQNMMYSGTKQMPLPVDGQIEPETIRALSNVYSLLSKEVQKGGSEKELATQQINKLDQFGSAADQSLGYRAWASGAIKESKGVEEDQQTCNECGGTMYEGHSCDSEELNEWANSPMGGSADEDFQTEIDYMTRLISGGLNGQKRDQTTLPHTKVKTEIVKEDISSTMKKLAGIK